MFFSLWTLPSTLGTFGNTKTRKVSYTRKRNPLAIRSSSRSKMRNLMKIPIHHKEEKSPELGRMQLLWTMIWVIKWRCSRWTWMLTGSKRLLAIAIWGVRMQLWRRDRSHLLSTLCIRIQKLWCRITCYGPRRKIPTSKKTECISSQPSGTH